MIRDRVKVKDRVTVEIQGYGKNRVQIGDRVRVKVRYGVKGLGLE